MVVVVVVVVVRIFFHLFLVPFMFSMGSHYVSYVPNVFPKDVPNSTSLFHLGGGEDFLSFFSLFPSCSQWVLAMFPTFPMCSPRMFPIAPHFFHLDSGIVDFPCKFFWGAGDLSKGQVLFISK